MKGYLYILQSNKNGRYYIGSTNNPDRRLEEHNGKLVTTTQYLVPLKMVFCKEYQELSEARNIERKLKRQKSRILIEKIIKDQNIFMGQ